MLKVFIVARDRDDIYASLCRVLENERGVFVIYDRRSSPSRAPSRGGWRSLWPGSEPPFDPGDRRRRPDVDEHILERGFGVVHLMDEVLDDTLDDDDDHVDDEARHRED